MQEVSWEVTPMQINVALRGRTRLAALLQQLEQEADQREQEQRCERRNRQTWTMNLSWLAHSRRWRI